MGLGTTAECIESDAIRTIVAGLGVDFGQGYALGRPRPLNQVLQELLAASRSNPSWVEQSPERTLAAG
jgi:EAL domain-containing protein (putative c-di-GMP-specific phosphodiesterase class I)